MAKKVIIIGAGLAGLSAGIFSRINGYETTIFEQHSSSGGLATGWKRKDYYIDGGIHFFCGNFPTAKSYRIYKTLGLEFLVQKPITNYSTFLDESSKTKIDVTNDLDKLRRDLLALFPDDKKIINTIVDGALALSSCDLSEFGFDKPSELMGIKDYLNYLFVARTKLRYFLGKYNQTINNLTHSINSPLFRSFLLNFFLPESPIWFIMLLLSFLKRGELSLLSEGSHNFSQILESRFIDLGGSLHFRSEVSKILVENNCAVGIKLASGDSYYADYVISASDGYSTIYQLLEGKYVDTSIQARYSSWSITEPMLMFSYGFNAPSPPLNWMTLLNLREPFLLADTLVSSLAVRNFSYGNRFAPTNKSLIQVSFESDWDFWYNLYENDLEQYKVLKKEYALLILDIICKNFDLPQDKHELTDVATPITFWRYTKNYRGSFMGFLPSPKEAMKPIDKSIKGLSNFFMAGQWSMAMGGVQPVLYSGKHVIELLCNKDKKKFKT